MDRDTKIATAIKQTEEALACLLDAQAARKRSSVEDCGDYHLDVAYTSLKQAAKHLEDE